MREWEACHGVGIKVIRESLHAQSNAHDRDHLSIRIYALENVLDHLLRPNLMGVISTCCRDQEAVYSFDDPIVIVGVPVVNDGKRSSSC